MTQDLLKVRVGVGNIHHDDGRGRTRVCTAMRSFLGMHRLVDLKDVLHIRKRVNVEPLWKRQEQDKRLKTRGYECNVTHQSQVA
jgi:hypothetical protein